MKIKITLFLCAVLCLLGATSYAQTASTTISPTTITTIITDKAGNSYKATTPYSISVAPGSTSLVFTPVVVVPPPVITPPPPSNGAPAIPTTAKSVNLITQGTWKACEHDAGTPGTGRCSNNYPVNNIFFDAAGKSIDARGFSMSYTGAGGVRWANSLANDTAATNFVLDARVESPDWTHVADLELDTNQVKSNGKTTILGTQCASQEKTWDITLSGANGAWHWVKTNVACNPLTWTPNASHHIRIFGTISAAGISTYLGVEFDGTYSAFSGATGSTADSLGWGVGTVLDNVQIDGYGAYGSATVYMSTLTIYRW
jgi:hypothetical protein